MFLSGQTQGLREHLDLSRLLVISKSIVAVILWGQKLSYERQIGIWKMEAVDHLFSIFVID